MATNRAPQVEAVAGLFLGLAWLTTILRLYVKGFMVKVFGLEDWLAVLAVLLFTATAAFALAGISHSMGMHLTQIPLTNLAPAMMYWFSTELSYVMTTCVLKLSIIVFLLRIATQKAHKIILYIIMSIVISVTIAYFFFLVFQCSPVDYFWNQFSGEVGSCLSPKIVGGMTYAHSGVNAGADVILAVLPVAIVSQLQMNIRTKLTVSSILSLGLLAAVAVIIRIPFVKILVDNASDFLYSSTDVVLWSAIEPGLGITAANMATLRPLFSTFLSRSKLLGGTTTAKDKPTGYTASKSKSGFSSRNGYVRSRSKGGEEEFEMANGGVTTIVQGDGYDSEKGGPGLAITTSEERLDPSTPEWDTEAQKGLSRPKASEDWPIAIRKTVRMEVFSETLETLEAGWEPRDSQLSMLSLDSPATRISHTPSLGGLTPHGW